MVVTKEENHTILLVDDEEGIRRVLSITLADMGYQVLNARDGAEALELFEKHMPPIVLADIKMPGISGIELLKAIKARRSDTEVIMMTGHGDMASAIESLKLEATDFITKPLYEDALAIALKRAGERITMREQLTRYTEQLEEMVAEKTRQLIEAERMAAIGQTITGLSHTIKNIVSGLKGGAFGVDKGLELNEPRYLQEGWQIVKKNVEKITRLSLDLLNYAKTAQHHCQWENPNQPLKEVADLIQPKAARAGITIALQLHTHLEPLYFDTEKIYQALLNLAMNALESFNASEARDKRILLKTSRPHDYAVAYHIEDNGTGIEQAVQNKVFNTFFTTKGSDGTGVGLMMTKIIVDKHNGKIIFASDPGKGTRMSILLPKGRA